MLSLHIKKKRTTIYHIYILLFFTLVIWMPSGGKILKIIVLFPILVASIIHVIENAGLIMLRRSHVLVLIMVFSNIMFCIYGIIKNNPGAIRVITIDIVWPLIYIIISFKFPQKKDIESMLMIFLIMGDLLAIYDLTYTISNVMGCYSYVKPIYELFDTGVHYGYNASNGFFSFNSDHGMFYAFFTPVVVAMTYFKCHHLSYSRLNRKFIMFSFFLLVSTCILSGKRVIQLSPIIAIFLLGIFFNKRSSLNIRNLIKIYIIMILIVLIFIKYKEPLINFTFYHFKNIISGFNWNVSDINTSEYARGEQARVLLAGWSDNPFFGHGAGSYSRDYYRLKTQLWGYELSYHALLFQKGVVGLTIFAYLCLFTLKRLYKKAIGTDGYIWMPYLLGYIMFLIGNAFNPFFGRSSMLWIFYLPLLISDM